MMVGPISAADLSACVHVVGLNCCPVSEGTPEGDNDTTNADAGADRADGAGMPVAGDDDAQKGIGAVAGADETGPSDGDTDAAGDANTGGSGRDAATRPTPSPSPYRRAGFSVARGLVVLAVAAVGYQLVVPDVHVERGRLARLVLSKPGVAAFNKTAPQAGEQDDTKTGVAALTAAAKRSPHQTGIYSIQWVPTQTSGVGIVAFLLPSDATAATTLAQVRVQQESAGSFSSSGLTRTSTFTVPAVPGSSGAQYAPSSKAGASLPGLAVSAFRDGRVVALVDASTSNSTDKATVDAVTTGEYGNLHRLGSGFGLSVTRRPVVATVLWVVAAVVLAAIGALTPVVRRRRAEKRRRAYEAEMANRVVVGRRVIVKHRR